MSSRLPYLAAWNLAPGDGDTAGDEALFTPLGYEPSYDYPLLVWLPDQNGDGRFDLGRVMKRVSLRNFIAVQPGGSMTDRDEAVWASIDRVCDRLSVHRDRIYLVGQGSGGTEAFRIACRHPRAFAGAISLGGDFPLGEQVFSRLHDVRRLPMLLCCHRDAPAATARQTDRTLRLFHAAGATLAMRICPGRNPLSKAILGDVNRWLMDEVCGTSTVAAPQCAR